MDRRAAGRATAFAALLAASVLAGRPASAPAEQGPDLHGDPATGVRRLDTFPPTTGDCVQCHDAHASQPGSLGPNETTLFQRNDNSLCFSTSGASPCHQAQPTVYPATESDRMPSISPYPGYFERNAGGVRSPGVDQRSRWPGALVYETTDVVAGRYLSPHGNDPDMPRQDASGRGLCLNCHDPHPTPNAFDLLVDTHSNSGGRSELGPPSNFALCFSCHGDAGPAGMNPEGRRIADYYDASLNGDHAGHQVRMSSDVAISWPPHLGEGDELACSNCHNAHGSQGSNGVQPNAYLLSDQRPGWYGLIDPRNDPAQNRRFCLGCHISSDGMPGSQEVEGIVMNALSDKPAHDSADPRGCNACHGNDYGDSRSHNVHNPGHGERGPGEGWLD